MHKFVNTSLLIDKIESLRLFVRIGDEMNSYELGFYHANNATLDKIVKQIKELESEEVKREKVLFLIKELRDWYFDAYDESIREYSDAADRNYLDAIFDEVRSILKD